MDPQAILVDWLIRICLALIGVTIGWKALKSKDTGRGRTLVILLLHAALTSVMLFITFAGGDLLSYAAQDSRGSVSSAFVHLKLITLAGLATLFLACFIVASGSPKKYYAATVISAIFFCCTFLILAFLW